MHPTATPGYRATPGQGVVERIHGAQRVPGYQRAARGEHPQWLYSVRFDARVLWGDDSDPGLTVSIDAWESYLEPTRATDSPS